MKLLLSGGGDPEKVAHIDRFFMSLIDSRKAVLYIPVAWEDDPSYKECFDWFNETYQPMGIKNMEMAAGLKQVSGLNQYSAVFIGGGNTYKLLKEIKDSRFDKKLVDYLNNGGVVYGGSAGSIIFGKDIIGVTYGDENNVGLEDTKGLNLVKGCDILCHYGEDEADTACKRERVKKYAAPGDFTIALPEDCGIFVEYETITFLGSGAVILGG